MLEVKLTRTTCDAYGLYDYRVVPFGGTPYITIVGEIFVDGEQIGRMTMYELDADINLFDMEYQIPGDSMIIAEHICNNNGTIKNEYVEDKFVILDNLFIDPEYRNKGYGSLVVKDLLVCLNDAYEHRIDSVILYASMYDFDDCEEMNLETFNKQSERLIKFYTKAGFSNIGDGIMLLKKG